MHDIALKPPSKNGHELILHTDIMHQLSSSSVMNADLVLVVLLMCSGNIRVNTR